MIGWDQSMPPFIRLWLLRSTLHTVQLRVLRLGLRSLSVLHRLALLHHLRLLVLQLLLALGDLRPLQVLAHLGVPGHFGLLVLSDFGVFALAGSLPRRSLDLSRLWLRAFLLSLFFSGFWLLLLEPLRLLFNPFRLLLNPFVASLIRNLINGIENLLFPDLRCSD